ATDVDRVAFRARRPRADRGLVLGVCPADARKTGNQRRTCHAGARAKNPATGELRQPAASELEVRHLSPPWSGGAPRRAESTLLIASSRHDESGTVDKHRRRPSIAQQGIDLAARSCKELFAGGANAWIIHLAMQHPRQPIRWPSRSRQALRDDLRQSRATR